MHPIRRRLGRLLALVAAVVLAHGLVAISFAQKPAAGLPKAPQPGTGRPARCRQTHRRRTHAALLVVPRG